MEKPISQFKRQGVKSRSTSRENTMQTLKRNDPQIKYSKQLHFSRQRLDSLVKSAAQYKTKSCGVMRMSIGGSSGMNKSSTSRVVIDTNTAIYAKSTLRYGRTSFHQRKGSNTSSNGYRKSGSRSFDRSNALIQQI